ncbi:MAG: hypothetical protein EOL98_04925 [Negativicutes bacterium]|nr:hypothetical protein [Negativicutes bacterium]
MSNFSLEETRKLKVLLRQIESFIVSVEEILNNEKSVEHSRYVSFKDMASIYNDLADQVAVMARVPSIFFKFDTGSMKGYMDTLWGEQKRILEQVLVSAKMLFASLEGNLDFVEDEFENLENIIASRLRTMMFKKPEKEVEVQNGLESLFIGRGMNKGLDYDRETGKLEFSGKEFIPDFVIYNLKASVEVKLLREGKKSQIIEEISADITAYSKIYERQLFVVYDLGVIQNEDEFKRDIENVGNIRLVIIKH